MPPRFLQLLCIVYITILPSLKLTYPLKMNGWNTFSFPFGALNGLFSGANLLLVLGRVILLYTESYCWWRKSCTTWDVWNPINNGINYLSTGAGFPPSTVLCDAAPVSSFPPTWAGWLHAWCRSYRLKKSTWCELIYPSKGKSMGDP